MKNLHILSLEFDSVKKQPKGLKTAKIHLEL
jgi:hypothetical protein